MCSHGGRACAMGKLSIDYMSEESEGEVADSLVVHQPSWRSESRLQSWSRPTYNYGVSFLLQSSQSSSTWMNDTMKTC